jgi:hypothetical protein
VATGAELLEHLVDSLLHPIALRLFRQARAEDRVRVEHATARIVVTENVRLGQHIQQPDEIL